MYAVYVRWILTFTRDLSGKVLRCQMILVPFGPFRGHLIRLLLEKLLGVCLVDFLSLGSGDAVATPLPELASADFCSRSILLKHC